MALPPSFLDLVVELFQPALRARRRNDMRAGLRQRECRGKTDAARGAGDESDAVSEGLCHGGGFTGVDGRDKPGQGDFALRPSYRRH